MRTVVVVCVLVMLLMLGTTALGVIIGDGGGGPSRDEIREGWTPDFPGLKMLNGLLAVFRPRIDLDWPGDTLSLAPREVATSRYAGGDRDPLPVSFRLALGAGVTIEYQCPRSGVEPAGCQRLDLCAPNRPRIPAETASCAPVRPLSAMCPPEGDAGEIVVCTETGSIRFIGAGGDAGGGTVARR